jgi:predicted DCC family thiol-disulfide oxidoreductase YuxK
MYAVIYDGNCNLCVTLVRLLEQLDKGQQFSYVPMQDTEKLQYFEVSAADCELGMLLIDCGAPDRRWQGSNAAEEIGRLLPMGEMFVQAYRAMPGVKATGDRAYTYVRDNRYDLFGKRDKTYWPSFPLCDTDSCR